MSCTKHIIMKQVLLTGLLCLTSLAFGQKMRFKVDGVKDTTIFLTKYYGSKLFYADTAEMKNGVVEFNNPDLKPGLFALLMPGQKYFEFIYNKEPEISIETTLADMVGSMKVKKSEENKVFIGYVQFIQKERTKTMEFSKQREGHKKEEKAYAQLNSKIDSITKIVTDYQAAMLKNHPEKLATKMIRMSIDVVIPDYPKDEKGQVIDSSFRYKYYKAHFWDNIDLKDDRLVNTPVFAQKIEYFFGKNMLVQHPDTVVQAAYAFCDNLTKGSEMFRYSVDYITNAAVKSNIMGMDKVYVRMCERYYCKRDEKGKSYAYWMPEEKLETLCEDIAVKKNLVQGVVPPNIILRDTTDTKWFDFYSLKSEYTILYFWDPECGHCKKVTPKLQKLYAEKLKARNIEVFAVGKATGDDFEKWKKYIKDNNMTFINVALTRTLYEAAVKDASIFVPKFTTIESLNYHDTYDLYATPRIIVLDKDKKIIAKQLTISQLEDLLDRLQNIKDPVKLFPPDPEEEAH